MARITVKHPSGEDHPVSIPDDHNGSRVKVEFPDGQTAYTDGWDPAERAIAGDRPTVPCGQCGALQVLTSNDFECSACGARNQIELHASSDAVDVQESAE